MLKWLIMIWYTYLLKLQTALLGARNPKNNWHNYFYYSVINKVSNTEGNEARWSKKKKKGSRIRK